MSTISKSRITWSNEEKNFICERTEEYFKNFELKTISPSSYNFKYEVKRLTQNVFSEYHEKFKFKFDLRSYNANKSSIHVFVKEHINFLLSFKEDDSVVDKSVDKIKPKIEMSSAEIEKTIKDKEFSIFPNDSEFSMFSKDSYLISLEPGNLVNFEFASNMLLGIIESEFTSPDNKKCYQIYVPSKGRVYIEKYLISSFKTMEKNTIRNLIDISPTNINSINFSTTDIDVKNINFERFASDVPLKIKIA